MKYREYIYTVRAFTVLTAALAAIVLTLPAAAMSVTPIVLDMSTAGAGNHSQISVVNDGAKPLPVEIVVSRIELDEKGEMSSKPAGDEFLIFPPQALVAAGATQNFRIQWVGEPQIKTSQSYVFSVNQVPVKMPEGKSGVQVVFNFATIVNIAPPGGKAGIEFVKAGVGKDDKGKTRPEVTVKNPGNVHAKLTDATIKLSAGSWSQTLAPEQLRQSMGVGLVQPGKTRWFILPADLPEGVTQVTASIEYKQPSK
jgi:P pilus assembly chaperone PapD